ncbi:MAG: hypothetical protein J6W12_02750 [Bacteroidales bacterium]|nr:hypothetical protein [Bacteroidales bacterium]
MKRIKLLIIAALVMLTSFTVKAQEMTFEQMMPVRVLMPVNKEVKGDALTVLYNRLNQAVTLNGLGSTTNDSRFLIVSSVTVLSKEATASVPVQYMAEVEVAVYFVDNVTKVILSQEMITKKGLDNTDDLAVSKAIKQIQARDPKLKKLIKIGKDRAIQYYQATEGQEESEGDPDVSWIFEK